jgi:hypothetical protein
VKGESEPLVLFCWKWNFSVVYDAGAAMIARSMSSMLGIGE